MEITAAATAVPAEQGTRAAPMPALTGIRFFAIFHIFLFHLWTLYDLQKPPQFQNLLAGIGELPQTLIHFFSNGWVATSFFFLLSGFLLAHLYWGADGALTTSKKRFWLQRFTRIYPIHILLMVLTVLMTAGWHLSQGMGATELVGSALLTVTLLQAWVPPAVPVWSWPTWTLSALVFLYWIMPWLMPRLARLSRRQMWGLLAALPLISLIPTAIYAVLVPAGSDPGMHWKIFLGSTPIFWLPHFMAGMLLSRLLQFPRAGAPALNRPWLAWGDLALLAIIVVACQPTIAEPVKYFLRHGLMMPLYMLLLVDLARGRGLAARLFSLPGTGFLGETGFAIFIWQNLVMTFCWLSLMIDPDSGRHHLWAATLGIIVLGIFSTYVLEKPAAKWLRRKLLK